MSLSGCLTDLVAPIQLRQSRIEIPLNRRRKKVGWLFQAQPRVCTWDRQRTSTYNRWTDVKTLQGLLFKGKTHKGKVLCIMCLLSDKLKISLCCIVGSTYLFKSNVFLGYDEWLETFSWHEVTNPMLHSTLMMAECVHTSIPTSCRNQEWSLPDCEYNWPRTLTENFILDNINEVDFLGVLAYLLLSACLYVSCIPLLGLWLW